MEPKMSCPQRRVCNAWLPSKMPADEKILHTKEYIFVIFHVDIMYNINKNNVTQH